MGWMAEDSRSEEEIFLHTSRLVLGPGQSLIQRELGTVSLGVKREGRHAYHSFLSNAEVKNDGAIPLLLHTSSCLDPL
jgi:hypothetical protein